MSGIYVFDLWLQKVVQAIGGSGGWQKFMDFVFCSFTFLCEELFLLVAILVVYWVFNKKMGEGLMMAMFMSISTNAIFKNCVRRPRPFMNPDYTGIRYVEVDNFFVDTNVLSTSYSFPSGHSQLAGSFFGTYMLLNKKRWLYILCPILIVMVMASRVYLGVHYPTDTIMGGIIGVGIAFLTTFLINKFYHKKYYIYAALIALFIINVSIPYLFDMDSLKFLGTAIGAVGGIVLDDTYTKFKVKPVWWKALLRVIIGFGILVGLKEGLKPLFNLIAPNAGGLHSFLQFLRYLIVGFFATGIWPLVFTKLKF